MNVGDDPLFWAAWLVLLAPAVLVGWSRVRRGPLVPRVVAVFRRLVEDWRMAHVDRRCNPDGCSCPCGYCRHDRRHVPGGA